LKTPLTAENLESLHDQVITYFEEKWNNGAENERYKKIKNWTPDQEKKIKNQGRQVYSIPIAVTKLNTIEATQKQARSQFDVKAKVDPNDEIKAELAKLMLRDDEKLSKFQYVESEIFSSGMSVMYGVGEAYVDYSKIIPTIKFRKIDYRNFVWDKNAKDYLLEDALWCAKIDRMYRYEVDKTYGKTDINGEKLDLSVDESTFGREKSSYYISKNPNQKEEFDVLSVFTHFQKVIRTYWYVIHPNQLGFLGEGVYMKRFKDKKEAEMHLREINIPYIVNGFDRAGEVQPKDEVAFDKYIFADGKILRYEETNDPAFQPKLYRSFHFEDDFWCFMDVLKSPQKFYDRLWAQIDYSFGSDIKTVYQLNVNALADGMTYEKAKEIIVQTGGVVPSNSSEAIMQAIKAQGVNPQWLQIATIAQGLMEDFGGGRSFSGLGDESGESGRAINLKKQQGALVAFLMLDNLARWKQAMGEFALYLHSEFDTVERQIKVQGGELSPEMMQVLNGNGIVTPSQTEEDSVYVKVGGIDFLKDAELELTVTEAALTSSEKESQYLQLLEMGRANQALWQMPAYILMLMEFQPNIPQKLKKELIAGLKQANEQAQQQAQTDSNIQKAKILQDGVSANLQFQLGLQNKQQNKVK
jgi:hypothetical protein